MQTVSQAFHDMAQNGIRPHAFNLLMSFDKAFDDDIEWFTLDVSLLNGNDLLKPSDDNPIQEWDYYLYQEFTDRLTMLQWEREIDFPFSMQSGLADFTLNNYDDYFSPDSLSPLAEYILPKRPFKLFSGFKGIATLQQFVGMTERMPVIDERNRTADFHGLDFLSEMFTMPTNKTIAMANVRTDEVLSAIFEQFGLAPTQYDLAVARNTIPFVFYDKGENTGDILRRLMQAEMGNLWLDEQGIIKFRPRLETIDYPVIELNDSNVEEISTSGDNQIINTVRLRSTVRAVQEFQTIWAKADSDSNSNLFIIPANSTKELEVNLEDPCLSAVPPELGFSSAVSWFTVRNALDEEVFSGVEVISDELRTNTYTMVFENTNAFAVEINAGEVWGEPAKEVDAISYEAYDEESVAKYGEQVLDIENDFFGKQSNCESFARTILDAYSEYAPIIEATIKGDPSVQLGDIADVDTRNVIGEYRIFKMTDTYQDNKYTKVIKARRYNPRSWFILDVSLLDGSDVLAP